MRDAAIASGAQFVSTDYPVPDPDFGTGYMVAIPDGMPARCNPISAPPELHATRHRESGAGGRRLFYGPLPVGSLMTPTFERVRTDGGVRFSSARSLRHAAAV